MKTYVEHFVAEESKNELDLEFPYYDGDEDNDVIIPYDHLSYVEDGVPSIPIDDVVEMLTKLKKAGANRVYIAPHCDHHGYYFYGVKLAEETPEEYELRMEKEAQRDAMAKERRRASYLRLKEEFES